MPPNQTLIYFNMKKFLYLFVVLAFLIGAGTTAFAQEYEASPNGSQSQPSEDSDSSRGPAGGRAIKWHNSRPGATGGTDGGSSNSSDSTSTPEPENNTPDETPGDLPVENEGGIVLSAEECGQYLLEYIHIRKDNNPEEVTKLQLFLNDYMKKNLEINGVYDQPTFDTVKEFQVKEKEEVLEPWGIDEPTGYVYVTTRRRINNIKCPDLNIPMPEWLSPDTNIHDNV